MPAVDHPLQSFETQVTFMDNIKVCLVKFFTISYKDFGLQEFVDMCTSNHLPNKNPNVYLYSGSQADETIEFAND